MAKKSVKDIRESLLKQLQACGGDAPHFVALIDDYCNYDALERKYSAAAKKLLVTDANAIKLSQLALSYGKQKVAILKELGLKINNVISEENAKL